MIRNVYMIDDGWNKQEWFLLILGRLNILAQERRLDIEFLAGFGQDHGENYNVPAASSQNASKIFEALQDPLGIYLIDLALFQTTEDTGELHRFLKGSNDLSFQAAAREYEQLKDLNTSLGKVAKLYPTSIEILLYCRRAGRPSMFISTEAAGWQSGAVRDAKLAKVSWESFPNSNLSAYPPSEKEMVEITTRWALRVLALLDPLEHIRAVTPEWFRQNPKIGWNSYEKDGLPHNLDELTLDRDGYRDCVRKALPWVTEDCSWWTDYKRARALHECLKTLMGSHAPWMGGDPQRGLSLGGAYIVFLIALAQVFPEEIKHFVDVNWVLFGREEENGRSFRPYPFLPLQERTDAERSLQALYEFFVAILPLKGNEHQISVAHPAKPITEGTGFFRLRLNWSGDQIKECTETLRSLVFEGFSKEAMDIKQSKTTGAFLRFVISAQVRNTGMGKIATISLDENGWLKLGR